MLEANNLSCVRDERTLFSALSFVVNPGDIVQIDGANGAGKSSLLRILAGLNVPDEGDVYWQGHAIRSEREFYHQSLLFLGHQPGIKSLLTPSENLAFYGVSSTATEGSITDKNERIWDALARVGLAGYEDVPVAQLSAGRQRRVALARLWLSEAPLWILDEPLTAIDQQGVLDLITQMAVHRQRGGMVILTTHQALPALANPVTRIRLTVQECY